MKAKLTRAKQYYDQVHPLPMWIFSAMLLSALIGFGASAAVGWFPALLECPADSRYISGELFQLGLGLAAIGFILAPLVDIVIKYDLEQNH